MLDEPGTRMQYSTGNTHLLSAILTRATGRSTWQFAQEVLARPLGFSLPQWQRDPQGVYFGGNEMVMTPRQMIAFGELYLNRGRVGERQIVPEEWIDDSLVPRGRSNFSEQMYGYGWWILFVVPELDLVVVSTSAATVGDDRRTHRRTVDEIVEELIVAPLANAD
jgi:CubicO group peptidase (beta-lactamase class C family)